MKQSGGDGKRIMYSAQPPEVEIFFLSTGELPFICGAKGHVTIDMLAEIEKDCEENAKDIFDQGDGSYLFLARHNDAQIGDEGRVEVPAYWELDFICFEPLQA